MWNAEKAARLENLREREAEGSLTASEHAELALMFREIEEAEATYLRPATERLVQETQRIAAQNQALEALLRREETLAARLLDTVNDLEAERRAIDRELARILGKAPVGARP